MEKSVEKRKGKKGIKSDEREKRRKERKERKRKEKRRERRRRGKKKNRGIKKRRKNDEKTCMYVVHSIRLQRRWLTRSHKRTSMGPSRSCWNGTTSALQLEEITSKGIRVSWVYYQQKCPYEKSLEIYRMHVVYMYVCNHSVTVKMWQKVILRWFKVVWIQCFYFSLPLARLKQKNQVWPTMC